jgi:Spy/CpxP family protein refolding chaperone
LLSVRRCFGVAEVRIMIGFLIGTACLIGLVKVLRHGRRWGGGCHGGHAFGGGSCGGGRGWGGGGRFGGGPFSRRGAARFLFEILDTTPGQEKVILTAMDGVRTAGEGAREELRSARREAAQAMRGDVLDDSALRAASAKLGVAGEALRESMTHALAQIHEVLEPDQRRRLAELITDGPAFFERFSHGPYRRGWEG